MKNRKKAESFQYIKEFDACTNSTFENGVATISCKLGNWSVSGPSSVRIIVEAKRYFDQYKMDGEYDDLLATIQNTKINGVSR